MKSLNVNLENAGIYYVEFQVSVTEAGQLELTLDGTPVANSVVGRTSGTSQMVGCTLITSTVANSVLTVRNPAGNATALTITPSAGGNSAVSASLVIIQLR